MIHRPVLLQEVIHYTNPQKGESVVDGTLGFAGHAVSFCEAIGPTGKLLGLDEDEEALKSSRETLANCSGSVEVMAGNFRHIANLASSADIVLLDLGMSSFQLDSANRGFSFQKDEPLLMTLKTTPKEGDLTADSILNDWSEEDIANVLYGYGGEVFARRIARKIAEERINEPIRTTGDLVEIVEMAVPGWYKNRKIHPATKTFQALRIAVNDELEALKEGLVGAWQILNPAGRLAVISFHSLEAKLVKEFFNEKKKTGAGELVTKKAIKPTREEVLQNPRSRSAQLRVIKKHDD